MLDKTLPYVDFMMERKLNKRIPLPQRHLPEGYQLSFFTPGDEADWCKIETAVGEFDRQEDATTYFQKTFAPYPNELRQRMMFVIDPTGEKVATCTAWWTREQGPLFHWLAVTPKAQGQGIAGYLAVKTTTLLEELYPDQPAKLHTQTWSHQAIGIYEKLGYELVPGTKDFDKGLAILAGLAEKK